MGRNWELKIGNTTGESFKTTTGIMQGDCLSAILFVFYLAMCLRIPLHTKTKGFLINPTYADDITFAGTNKQQIDEIEEKMTKQLDRYNLKIPRPKPPPPTTTTVQELLQHKDNRVNWLELDWLVTYKPPISESKSTNWTKCKLLRSLLDTTNDIDRRKILTIKSTKTFEHIYKSKRINTELKIRTFNTYTASIFLYNSELWTLAETMQNIIDAFHRKLLRRVINI